MDKAGVAVEAYSGTRYGERPVAFTWQGRRYEVLSVERRWRTPAGLGFVVTTASRTGGAEPGFGTEDRPVERWQLTYNEVRDHWHVRRAVIDDDRRG